MGVFTDRMQALAFAERMEAEAAPVEMDFDEIAKRSEICKGILVDAATIGYRLEKDKYDTVRDLRTKPLMFVRLQPPKSETVPQEAPAPAPKAELGSLPNPDAFDVPPVKAEQETQQQKTEAPAAQEEAPKKGFFRRLFGK